VSESAYAQAALVSAWCCRGRCRHSSLGAAGGQARTSSTLVARNRQAAASLWRRVSTYRRTASSAVSTLQLLAPLQGVQKRAHILRDAQTGQCAVEAVQEHKRSVDSYVRQAHKVCSGFHQRRLLGARAWRLHWFSPQAQGRRRACLCYTSSHRTLTSHCWDTLTYRCSTRRHRSP
jgi:hypothetical protein